QREALPWWIFGVLGGSLTAWLAGTFFLSQVHGLAAKLGMPVAEEARSLSWPATIITFLPGMLVGGLIGWFVIGAVNRVLAAVFGAFNRAFDKMTSGYAWSVGKVLRVSVLVLVVYGGLLGLTYFQFRRAPVGFIPQQDKGYLTLNVQLPDSASIER